MYAIKPSNIKMKMKKSTFGFTFVEMLVVLSIIAILITLGFSAYNATRVRSYSTRIAADFQQIKLGFKIWKSFNNDALYPRGNTLGQNPSYNCISEGPIAQTPAQTYLNEVYLDPWGNQYAYDNNGDVHNDAVPAIANGVNVFSRWCAGEGAPYIQIAAQVDRILDGDGSNNTGVVRWNTNPNSPGAIVFLIAPNESE